MGITFRYGGYQQFIRCGGRTIKDGEAAAVWDSKGVHTEIVGPKRVFLWYSTIRFLDRFKAESHQYLEIKYRNGSIENVRGPISMYMNPCHHDKITIKDGKTLKANEVLLVYHDDNRNAGAVVGEEDVADKKAKEAKQQQLMNKPTVVTASGSVRQVSGPTVFFPHANDIIGVFRWSVLPSDLSGLSRFPATGVPVERTAAIQLYTPTVWRVRVPIGTSASLKGYVTLGITYQIESIDKATSHADPRASLVSALLSEALNLSEAFNDDDFKGDQSKAREKLHRCSYAALAETAESCGFVINLIDVLDVVPSERIRMDMDREHNNRIDFENKIASKERKMRLRDLEFAESKAQLQNEEEMAKQQADMRAKIDNHSFDQRMAALQRSNEIAKKEIDAKLEERSRSDAQVLEFLRGLKDMGVDVGAVVCPKNNEKPIPCVENILGRLSVGIKYPNEDFGGLN